MNYISVEYEEFNPNSFDCVLFNDEVLKPRKYELPINFVNRVLSEKREYICSSSVDSFIMDSIDYYVGVLYDKMFTKYYHGNTTIADRWHYEGLSFKKGHEVKLRIRELLKDGYQVKTGYFTTDIRDYHDHALFYKK